MRTLTRNLSSSGIVLRAKVDYSHILSIETWVFTVDQSPKKCPLKPEQLHSIPLLPQGGLLVETEVN